jgi:carbon storage regulator CsrA
LLLPISCLQRKSVVPTKVREPEIKRIKEDNSMLVLSRQENQTIIFPNLGISVEVVRVKGKNVRIGIDAPRSIKVVRGELEADRAPLNESALFGQLESQLASLGMNARHEVRNHLNTASLAVNLAQKHIERGGSENADKFLSEAISALETLNRYFESLSPTPTETTGASASIPCSNEENLNVPVGLPLNKTALIVEDNDNERELLAGVLEMAGFEVIAVADGQAAIDFLELHEKPDVVLMDMNMPRLDGPETISKIRAELAGANLPIFGVSGLTQSEANIPLGERGVTGWFSKPVNPNQLLKYLQHEIENMIPTEIN